ncbi:MAG: S1 RNA-binding domain-containing protein, partial [Candidatus Altiarchaeota archaeon]|nr:S1 RNA-binding domain-containing protein [Candidatus Altiarchaeota archaeon]
MEGVEYPEAGELVLGTVKDIFKQGAFIILDEYGGMRGMLHLSEISLKWVRNIRDYVKEEQKVVLLVLGVNPEKGHIDLSLRRVTDSQRKQKLQQVKQRQRAEKLIEVLAKDLKENPSELKDKIGTEILKKYDSVYAGLEAIASDNSAADGLAIDAKLKKKLVELVVKSIKAPFVEITGYVEFRSYEPDGVNMVRKALTEIEGHKTQDATLKINYVSAPYYRV